MSNSTYKITHRNNFCRVFEIPPLSSEFCFSGGIPHIFAMIDWFNPVFIEWDCVEKTLDEVEADVIPFLRKKMYVKPGMRYLVIYDFGAASVFEKGA